MSQSGYYQQPTVCKDKIVFVCDDNLWSVGLKGGNAHKLSSATGECSTPRLSPDGKLVAFVSMEEGHPEVFVMPFEGGAAKRLTYMGGQSSMVFGWTADGKKILIGSDARAPFFRHSEIFELSPDGQEMTPLNLGHATAYSTDSKGRAVMCRNNSDPAQWKRYRGGRAGEIWIDNDGKGQFRPLLKLNGNLVSPMWVKGRIYFLSDHEGIANIYSCKPDGRDIQKHTNQKEYYVRFPSTDGERIIYSVAAELYVLDCASGTNTHINIQASSQEPQVSRKFVDPNYYLEHSSLHPHGHSLGFISRGQAFSMPLFEGPCIKHGTNGELRYRLFEWLADGEHFLAVDDKENYERVARYSHTDMSKKPEYLTHEDIGRILSIDPSPDGKLVAMSNHRFELLILDIEKKKTYLMDTSPAERISCMSWSPDNRWLAYTYCTHSNMSIVKVVDCKTYKLHEITRPVRYDFYPCFDPDGQYLYFLSNRDFKPIYDSQHFDLGFPPSMKPYVIPLQKNTPSPFAPDLKPFIRNSSANNTDKAHSTNANTKASKKSSKASTAAQVNSKDSVNIDFDGIADRIIAFPFEEGNYSQLMATKGRILFLSFAVKGISRDFDWHKDDRELGSLIAYDFGEQKTAVLQTGISAMRLGQDNQTILYRTKDRLRVVDGLQAMSKGPDGGNQSPGRATGFIDLGRCNLLIEPRKEWSQMYKEAWRLQREHFWDEKMSSVDWNLVYQRYAVLLPKIRTRAELSDLLWEMQGELGTSHAYEFGGDKPRPRAYYKGFLACDLDYDSKNNAYKISNILRGDSWDRDADSPLAEPGLNIEEGDLIVAVNGRRVSKELSVDELLIKAGYAHVQLSLKRGTKTRAVTVRTLHSDRYLRYRNWVQTNREIVKKATNDKVGYIHIPDMGPFGYAEFHRSYLSEFHHDGLIIDARYNRGGHVSSLLLEKLMRKRIGYDVPRWGQPMPYPAESPSGPLVAITNQFAASDGDIFSHCFKLYELGPLVGKRTWGGVIGIHPRHRLVDHSLTTQPEYSFWFQDVGWAVENHGTEPDYDVDYRPQDYNAGRDPQLEKAIALVQASLKKNPVRLPSFKSRPRLALPPVPKK